MPFEKTCIIAQQIKKQKVTSRNKIVNWFCKIFGYKYESVLPPGCNVVMYGDKLIFRDQETYDMVKNSLSENK